MSEKTAEERARIYNRSVCHHTPGFDSLALNGCVTCIASIIEEIECAAVAAETERCAVLVKLKLQTMTVHRLITDDRGDTAGELVAAAIRAKPAGEEGKDES